MPYFTDRLSALVVADVTLHAVGLEQIVDCGAAIRHVACISSHKLFCHGFNRLQSMPEARHCFAVFLQFTVRQEP